jgi:hypothetical protein
MSPIRPSRPPRRYRPGPGADAVTIRQIMADPRYREFAAEVTEAGRVIQPDAWPWKYMGQSDEEFLRSGLKHQSGAPIPPEKMIDLLCTVRAAERDAVATWSWWLELQTRDPAPPRRRPGMLFAV